MPKLLRELVPRLVNRKDGYDISICRPSKWGNPFSHLSGTLAKYQVSSIREAVACYRRWLPNQPELVAVLHELDGKRLACCTHPKPCHGEILIEIWWEKRGRAICSAPM